MSEKIELILKPIGYLRCKKRVKFSALHQPDEGNQETNVLEMIDDPRLICGLKDLAGFTRVWLIWWFHRNESWRPMVMPPRGVAQRRGVFATRSPHRPNPVGMSPVSLLGIEGRNLYLGACDLVDGTPIFDIKPYIPEYDSFPDESQGWLGEVKKWLEGEAIFSIIWDEKASYQRDWLKENWRVDFSQRVEEILSRDPSVHRTRRIRRRENGFYEIGCGPWRAIYRVNDQLVTIAHMEPGYPLERLMDEKLAPWIADRDAQVAYFALWPEYV